MGRAVVLLLRVCLGQCPPGLFQALACQECWQGDEGGGVVGEEEEGTASVTSQAPVSLLSWWITVHGCHQVTGTQMLPLSSLEA